MYNHENSPLASSASSHPLHICTARSLTRKLALSSFSDTYVELTTS